MNKQYPKYGHAVRRQPVNSTKKWLKMGLFLVIFAGAGIFLYRQHTWMIQKWQEAQVVSRLQTWYAAHHHKKTKSSTPKPRAAQTVAEETNAIHFEFYKTLPNTQVPLPVVAQESEK